MTILFQVSNGTSYSPTEYGAYARWVLKDVTVRFFKPQVFQSKTSLILNTEAISLFHSSQGFIITVHVFPHHGTVAARVE